ncbi:hypothetical protein [Bradyrhizobium sp. Leo121]|uniref:hypothetical protein n=1 Tax=Bradyrhizobium sp. Leo121 TaxID=1571195 RepID=UPI001029FB11|nr:hypothetical protein [Bradyrhizobium sp. Leo121]RZN33741.1 hypothetical protein CWO90_08995 [Bradyrhizobium sp. Leo121]
MASNVQTLSIGGYVLVGILLMLLAAVIVLAIMGWSSAAGTAVPAFGYMAMAIGILLSLVFGIGLMALLFYSSRSGYDEPARIVPSDTDEDPESRTRD